MIAVQAACGFLFVISGVLTVASLGAALSNDAGYARERMILLEGTVRRVIVEMTPVSSWKIQWRSLRRMPGVERVAVSTLQSTFLRPAALVIAVVPEGWKRPAEGATFARSVKSSSKSWASGRWRAAGPRLESGRRAARPRLSVRGPLVRSGPMAGSSDAR